ncbi:tetratricopeptide repeat-containing sensor histidine kinase [Arenibacter latericius]|uniref:tetratricopeptide repeat-containing sensor histidine kinase n=1 Tax=Arenibacter latericius TaxID=86104 RepID=UPI000420408E|nr:tetratricopeptide repeat-containing sensor histidine kinase [Arenibacter latericius]MDX1364258.1 tetratricopeptide repeat-containing sensor histidine kinase [Arenibacter latericius]
MLNQPTYYLNNWQNLKLIAFTLILYLFCHSISAQEKLVEEIKIEINEIKKGEKAYNEKNSYIALLNDLGSALRFVNSDSLLIVSKEAHLLSKETDNKEEESRALMNIGDYYSDKGGHKEAVDFYNQALVLAKTLNNTELIISIGNNLASEHMYTGNYALALKGYLENLELAEKEGDQTMESILNENIANLYASQKDFEHAIYFFEKVKNINKKIGDNITSAQTLSNLAYTYSEMRNFKDAHISIDKSIDIFKKNKIWEWLAHAYMVKGRIYLLQKKYSLALYWYGESDLLHKDFQDERGVIDIYNGMAEAHFALKNDSLALDLALKSYDISKKIKSMEGIMDGSRTLYKIYKNNNDYVTALKYHEIYKTISDSLSRDENRNSLNILKTEIAYKNQKEELIEENKKALAKQKFYIYLSLAAILILAIVAIIIFWAEKTQKRLIQELKKQKDNLEQRKLDLQASNETKDKLFSIIAHDLRGPIGALENVLRMFKSGDMNIEEFNSFLPKLKTDVNNISFTLNNLLNWGRSQMKASITIPSNILLFNIVQGNIDLLNELANTKMITVENLVPDNIYIRADKNQLNIVLRNLLSNAIKFTPNKGCITIGATEKNDHIEVFIKDTGQGIPPNIQEKILQENSNFTTYGTNNEKGTGLGLALCKEMLANNGGTLWIQSEVNKGSIFYFTVPNGKIQSKKSA